MYPYFRFGWTYLRARWRGRIPVRGEADIPLRVGPGDIDVYGHLNNGRYLTLMDLGRLDILQRTGFVDLVFSRRWLPLAGAATVRFRRSLDFLQAFTLRSRFVHWDEKWFVVEHRCLRGEHEVARAWVRFLVRGPEGNVPVAEVMEALGEDPVAPTPEDSLALWVDSLEASREGGLAGSR